MPIIGPTDLPAVLKVKTDPMKDYVMTRLGQGVVDVEITEKQLETVLRLTGDFICGYFPREQRLAWFQTSPLKCTYPLPKDAYWVEQVAWDPVSTNINDIFGAESYLFCVGPELQILAADGSMQQLGNWSKGWKAKTPYGPRKLRVVERTIDAKLPKLSVDYGSGRVEATCNHAIAVQGAECWGDGHRWLELSELSPGLELVGISGGHEVRSVDGFESSDAWSVRAPGSGCYYGCVEGEPVLLH